MKGFDPDYQNKIGVLITNLGTPDQPTKKSLRKYLKEFLSDSRVVDYNRILWYFILYGIILINFLRHVLFPQVQVFV